MKNLIFTLASTMRNLHCKKKLTENFASLTGCNRRTCKGDGKPFRHEDRVNPTSSDVEDGIFRNQWNFPTVFGSHAREFSDNFLSTFRRKNQKQHHRDLILCPSGLQSITLSLHHILFMFTCVTAGGDSTIFFFLSTCFPSSVLCFPSSVL
jgi:hypothetical protein